MENTKYLSLDYGNLSKGKPTLKFKNALAQNLIYCYNLSALVEEDTDLKHFV